MVPMAAALNNRPRRSQRASGKTAAVCEMVNGMSIDYLEESILPSDAGDMSMPVSQTTQTKGERSFWPVTRKRFCNRTSTAG
jgi:hypothetical protein